MSYASDLDPGVLEAYEAWELPLQAGDSERAFELAVLRFLERLRNRSEATARKKAT